MNGSSANKPSLILAIDFGTQSVRALVYTKIGECRAKHQLPIDGYQRPQPGWAEHDVEGFWNLLTDSCQGLWAQGVEPTEVAAVVVTTQRATIINLDEMGRPLRPAIVWTDQRRSPPRGRLPWLWRVLFALLRIRTIVENLEVEAEANWLERNQPALLSQTAHYLLLSGYLNYRLTGEFKDSAGSQVGYVPFDFKRQDWCADSDWKWHSMAIKRAAALAVVGETLGAITLRLLSRQVYLWTGYSGCADKIAVLGGCTSCRCSQRVLWDTATMNTALAIRRGSTACRLSGSISRAFQHRNPGVSWFLDGRLVSRALWRCRATAIG